jgi:hypothetical protein
MVYAAEQARLTRVLAFDDAQRASWRSGASSWPTGLPPTAPALASG